MKKWEGYSFRRAFPLSSKSSKNDISWNSKKITLYNQNLQKTTSLEIRPNSHDIIKIERWLRLSYWFSRLPAFFEIKWNILLSAYQLFGVFYV